MKYGFSKRWFIFSMLLIFSASANAMIKKQAGTVSVAKPKSDEKLIQAAKQTAQALSDLVKVLQETSKESGIVKQEHDDAPVVNQPQIIIDSTKKGESVDYLEMSPQYQGKLIGCDNVYIFVIRFNCDVTRDVSDLFSIFMTDCLSHHKNLKNVICYCDRIDHKRAIFRCVINKNPHQFRTYIDEILHIFFSIENMNHECAKFRKRFSLAGGNPVMNLFFR